MAYKKRTTRKPKRKVQWYNKKYSTKDLAKKAIEGVYQLKGIINSEKKKFDASVWSGNEATTAGLTSSAVMAIGQGDTIGSRNGNSILAKYLSIRGYAVTGQTTDQQLLFYVIMDTQQIADTSPSFSDIFSGSGVNIFLNAATVGRFKILKKIRISHISTTQNRPLSCDISLGNHHIRYNGTGSADLQKGGIYLIAVSNQATGLCPVLYMNTRLVYYDN